MSDLLSIHFRSWITAYCIDRKKRKEKEKEKKRRKGNLIFPRRWIWWTNTTDCIEIQGPSPTTIIAVLFYCSSTFPVDNSWLGFPLQQSHPPPLAPESIPTIKQVDKRLFFVTVVPHWFSHEPTCETIPSVIAWTHARGYPMFASIVCQARWPRVTDTTDEWFRTPWRMP